MKTPYCNRDKRINLKLRREDWTLPESSGSQGNQSQAAIRQLATAATAGSSTAPPSGNFYG